MKNIGLIGCGKWGRNILRDLIQLDCNVYVVDIDPAARLQALEKGARQASAGINSLPVCDGYVVAVPIPELTFQTARLLPLKKPIFAEKTLCLSMQDARLLRDSGGADYVFCMHKWRYHPGIEALRRTAQSGKIGKMAEVRTIRHGWVDDFHGGDVFLTLAVHDLTIVQHIVGKIPDRIDAVDVITDETSLPVSLLAVMGPPPMAVMSVNSRHCEKLSAVSIHGNQGTAMLHDAYDDHITLRNNEGEEQIPIDTTLPLFLELQEFVTYLDGGPKPRCGLENGIEVTRAILGLRKKAGLVR
jgi:predicted dehydrogenase